MYEFFYWCEVDILCLILLGWIIYQSKKNSNLQMLTVLFKKTVYSTISVLIMEMLSITIQGKPGTVCFVLNNIICAFYLIDNAIVAFYWFCYIIYYIGGVKLYRKIRPHFYIVFVVAFAILTLVSPWLHWIFYIDSVTNIFQKGDFFAVQVIITYGFFTSASFIALLSLFSRNPKYHSKIVTAFSCVLLPLIAGVSHLIFPDAKVVWQAISLAQFLIFCAFTFMLISIDSLTGLNNRRSFDSFMRTLSLEKERATPLYLYMLDVNLFKDINDTFGHPEGDFALEQTARLIKSVFRDLNGFIYRFGGDEFAAVCSCAKDEEAALMRNKIYEAFAEYNKDSHKGYNLTLSVGYAPFVGTGQTAVDLMIHRADEMLYEEKRKAHTAPNELLH